MKKVDSPSMFHNRSVPLMTSHPNLQLVQILGQVNREVLTRPENA
jgi:hypothetical protein